MPRYYVTLSMEVIANDELDAVIVARDQIEEIKTWTAMNHVVDIDFEERGDGPIIIEADDDPIRTLGAEPIDIRP